MKFFVKDEEGKKFEVEEVEEVKTPDADPVPEQAMPALTEDEIGALKKLALVADKLMGLITEKEEVATDEDPMGEKGETVVDTDEELAGKACDSKKSIGAIQTKSIITDSVEDIDEVNKAWAKRYGGNN